MSHNREKGGRVVFIGNIPYGVSEEQICEIFGRAGTVVNFRLVYDKETGRPKGFGFLEYTDVDAAAAAVRNLNEFELNGRTLRVDYSNDNDKGNRGGGGGGGDHDSAGRAPPPAHFNMGMPLQPNGVSPDALPQGVQLPPGISAPDAISTTLSNIEAPQLLDILSQMKALSQQEPARATALLAQAPQLGYAIFQALLQMGLVSTDILAGLIQQTQQPPQPQQPPPAAIPPPMPYQQPPSNYPPQPQYAQPPSYAQPPQGYAPTPPVQHQAYQPPQQPAAPAPFAGGQNPDQLMQTIMGLTREQIMGLDENSRNQVLALRSQMGMHML